MKFDKQRPLLSPEAVERLPEFANLNTQQKIFILLVAGGASIVAATQTAYECRNPQSAKSFAYELMRRRRLQPLLRRMFPKDEKSEFMNRLDKLLGRGDKVTDAEVNALILFGRVKGLLPHDFTVEDLK